MSEGHEAVFKLAAIVVALWGLWAAHRSEWARIGRRRTFLLAGLVGLGVLGYVNFGAFHTDGTPLHIWDQYHYVIGSKYFPELGYDGIYAATLVALGEKDPALVPPQKIRDLRTSEIVPTASLDGLMREVRSRFSDARWISFRADVTHFYLGQELFLDHGYNPPPSHVAVERIFTSHLPFRQVTAAFFASLDFILLALAGYVIYRAFDLETLAAASLMFGLGLCSRYYWVGGAFLRQDWLVAMILCAAALKCGRARLAGAALAYAACARVFPAFMLLPLGLFAVSKQSPVTAAQGARFAFGLIGTAMVLVCMGCFAGRGPGAWIESAQRLLVHSGDVGPNAIGLRIPFGTSLANFRGDLVDSTTLYIYTAISADYVRTVHEHVIFIIVASVLVVAFAMLIAWYSRDVVTAFVAGVGVIFALTTASCYYASYFVLQALVRPTRSAAVFLIANALMYVIGGALLLLSSRGFIRLNGAALYAPVSALLLGVLLIWMYMAANDRWQKSIGGQAYPDTAPAAS
jgi:hypothetical protein